MKKPLTTLTASLSAQKFESCDGARSRCYLPAFILSSVLSPLRGMATGLSLAECSISLRVLSMPMPSSWLKLQG